MFVQNRSSSATQLKYLIDRRAHALNIIQLNNHTNVVNTEIRKETGWRHHGIGENNKKTDLEFTKYYLTHLAFIELRKPSHTGKPDQIDASDICNMQRHNQDQHHSIDITTVLTKPWWILQATFESSIHKFGYWRPKRKTWKDYVSRNEYRNRTKTTNVKREMI